MQFLHSYLRPHRRLLIMALICAAINQIFSLFDPQVFRMIIDNFVEQYHNFDLSTYARGVGLLLLLSVTVAMISRIAKNIQDYLVNVLTQQIGMRLYQDTLDHLFTLPYKVFEDQSSGQILEKLRKARDAIQQYIANLINIAFTSLVGLTFVITYAFTVHRVIAMFYICILPVMGLTVFALSKKIKQSQQQIVQDTAVFSGTSTETLRNIALIKSLGLEHQELRRLEDANTKILGLEIKKIRLLRILEFTQGTMINFVRVCLMATLFYFVFIESITFGEFFSLYFYSFFIFAPLYEFGKLTQSYQEAKASDDVIHELQQLGVDEPDDDGETIISAVHDVVFDNVTFGYDGTPDVLNGVSVEARPGETIALVGPSGSGKSTMIKLLLGLYRPLAGDVRINDMDMHTLAMTPYKSTIGYVAQEAQLFAGTIRQNLQFVYPGATDDEMMEVLEQAQIGELISSSPDGLSTVIGEGGLKLSGGQRQRLAIARALLRNPSLLIFDEATSSLDSLVEAQITQTIAQIAAARPEMIMIVIAHRLSTIRDADRIYVMEQGSVVEEGEHDDLIQQKGLYYALRREQASDGLATSVTDVRSIA